MSRCRRSSGWVLVAGALPVMVAAGTGAAGAHPAHPAHPHPAAPAPAAGGYQPTQVRNGVVARPLPDQNAVAAIDPARLHAPTAVPPVAPIQAPPHTLRFGSLMVDAGGLTPAQVAAINDGPARAEAAIATGLDAIGMPASRSDRIAAQTMAGAAVGSGVGNVVASPLTATSAVVGAVAGLIAGVPFLPAGLVVMPVVGAGIGAAVIAAPAMAIGGLIGAAAGAVSGAAAPATLPAR